MFLSAPLQPLFTDLKITKILDLGGDLAPNHDLNFDISYVDLHGKRKIEIYFAPNVALLQAI